MHKVTTINLNGHSYQLEEQAYAKLHAYFERAEKELAADPDKAEIISDLEQAIADKCGRYIKGTKNVVTEQEVTTILAEVGQVEAEGDKTKATSSATPPRSKKLYRIGEGSKLAGVCTGLAAYFGADVNLIRLVMVVLALGTHGFGLLLYLVLALFVPLAKGEDELGEAYGRPVTAQEIVERAKERIQSGDSLGKFASAGMTIVRGSARLMQIVLLSCAAAATAVYLWALWMVSFTNLHLQAQLASIHKWQIQLALLAAFIVFTLPLVAASQILNRLATRTPATQPAKLWSGMQSAVWIIALAVMFVLVSMQGQPVRDYISSHGGYLDIAGHHICADNNKCGDNPQSFKPFTPRELRRQSSI